MENENGYSRREIWQNANEFSRLVSENLLKFSIALLFLIPFFANDPEIKINCFFKSSIIFFFHYFFSQIMQYSSSDFLRTREVIKQEKEKALLSETDPKKNCYLYPKNIDQIPNFFYYMKIFSFCLSAFFLMTGIVFSR